MSVVFNEVRRATYFDSIVLMRISRQIAALPGVEEAGLIIATPANKEILREAGILAGAGAQAEPGDLILALRANDDNAGKAALAEARRLLDQPSVFGAALSESSPRSIRTALKEKPDANLALISVPGDFAAAEARKALALGLHVMIFSDNVPIEQETALKREGRERGLLVMGPDCGTAIIGGLPLAFANVVPRGDIGIIGASGTGIQEVSCLIARAGRGVSHAIGTGGRDFSAEVGAITTVMAIDVFDADPETKHVVLVSKPPAQSVVQLVLDRVAHSRKPFTLCFLGAREMSLPANARAAATLKQAAELAMGAAMTTPQANPSRVLPSPACDGRSGSRHGKRVHGLFAGGSLCAEAQVVFSQAGVAVASNVPAAGASPRTGADRGHFMIDLGDDEFTRGRPHPMIEPSVRDRALLDALGDPEVGVILLDVVLGYGAHADPAGHLARVLAGRAPGPLILASVTGTDADPQSRSQQVRKLMEAGVVVADSNADAAMMALAAIGIPAQ